MRAFGAVAFEPELQEIAGLLDAAKAYVVAAIDLCGAALFAIVVCKNMVLNIYYEFCIFVIQWYIYGNDRFNVGEYNATGFCFQGNAIGDFTEEAD